jgi:selenocysteine lyase/cysteine desulfurase
MQPYGHVFRQEKQAMTDIVKYPIDALRARFPALKRTYKDRTVAYFDSPGGAQMPREVIDAMMRCMEAGRANIHCHFPSSDETMKKLENGRKAIAALFNARPNEVSYGANATTIMFQVARALMHEWNAGDEIVLTEMEHHSNLDSWRTAAEEKGVTAKYIPVDPSTLTLEMGKLPCLLSPKTRLLAIGLASNVTGTINDVKEASRQAHAVGAIVAADAVHAIPHFFVDREELGIDLLFASSYKFFGPHMGMAVIRKEILEHLRVCKVAPASTRRSGWKRVRKTSRRSPPSRRR